MAATIQVAGLVTVKADTGSAHSLETLGYTENGVEIQENMFTYDVHGDENGGDQGPPIDVQNMGQVDIIRMTFTKWDDAVMAKIRPTAYGGTAGTSPTAGALAIQGSGTFRLLIDGVNFDRNYTTVIFREAKELNVGTKHSKAVVVAHGYKNASGVIWNTTMS
jgi:hypothetical protein